MRELLGYILIPLVLITLVSGCKSKNNNITETKIDQDYNYPFEIIRDTITADVNDKSALFPMKEDVIASFLEKSQEFEGKRWSAALDFPQEWGVKCVERLQEGRELWEIHSISREMVYLVTTSGYGTQRILDVLPVAMNVTNQEGDELETESWTTTRLPDGQFITVKEYEWIYSMSKATRQEFINNPEKYHRKSRHTEQFFINGQGRFEKSEIVDTLPDYKAVVFYFNPEDKPLQWDETIPRLQSFCEENGILFEEVSQNYDRVTVRDFELTFALETDITPYVAESGSGMVMLANDSEPKDVHFGSFEYMRMEIRRFFKIRGDFEEAES